ncbi:MAG TPA: FG-GAP-like repeat-containing protein [Thermoanaerobaculia bacterium]|nr:FG-GAP-like repeat-containing protein [Thermoanaerobaculia bacterium]
MVSRDSIGALLLVGTLATAVTVQSQGRSDEERYREAARLAGAALADLEDGNLGRAQEGFEQLSRLMPENALPWINLAIVYLGLDRPGVALASLDRARAIDPDNAQLLYTEARLLAPAAASNTAVLARFEAALGRLDRLDRNDPRAAWLRGRFLGDQRRYAEAIEAFDAAHERSRDNLVVLVDRVVAAASARDGDATGDALDALEDRLNGFDAALAPHADRLRATLARVALDALRPAALVLENLLRPSDLYQVGRAELEGRGGGAMLFPQLDFVPPLPKAIQGGADIELALRDASRESGLQAALAGRRVLHLEVRRELVDDASGPERAWLLLEDGLATAAIGGENVLLDRRGLPALAGATRVWSHDLDQDAHTDLIVALGNELVLYPGAADGGFAEPRSIASGLAGAPRVLEPLDLDNDGDLDLLVVTGAELRYLQNRGAAGFVDATADLGVLVAGGVTGIAVADFDQDGALDLLLVHEAQPPQLLRNRRGGRFEDATERAGLAAEAPASGAVVADFDRDGRFDVLLWGGAAPARILYNQGSGSFRSEPLGPGDTARAFTAVVVADLDNDGDQDVVASKAGGVTLWRQREDGAFVPEAMPRLPAEADQLLALDLDGDGDLDLLARHGAGVTLLQNDGGNRNHWLRVSLRGLVDNNAKNNSEGLHALIEVRSGGAYQATLGNGGINHLGLGARRQADVLRVVWTNGLAQTWQQLAAGQTLVEKQVLKGSCPFLYTWNGEDFEFVTDLMWRSTLGMTFADGSAAPHQSARDWVLVPRSALRPAGDELWLQVTAELWETIYVDRQALWVVDLPPGVEAVVDESFRPPPHPTTPPLYLVERWLPPSAARDHAGRDVSAAIARRDGVHVDDLPLTRYQGATTAHELVLELDHRPRPGDGTLLVLWGWIFPTDTSINVALAQDPSLDATPPRLDVHLADGTWATVEPSIGIPMGKRKAMVLELGAALERAGLVDSVAEPLTIRLATTMQIYWDAAALGFPPSGAGDQVPSRDARRLARLASLEPVVADLHYRGFSRLWRESSSGPHLFDYRHTEVVPPFPPMAGRHTRHGSVLELLREEDDRYVVMAPGDELTLVYDARALPALPDGFTRDFILYTDGWVKDADLNTRESATVEPWPYHAMGGYPPEEGRSVEEPETRRWLESYQTRWLDDAEFRGRLSSPRGSEP